MPPNFCIQLLLLSDARFDSFVGFSSEFVAELSLNLGSASSAVGRAVACEASDLQFESRHHWNKRNGKDCNATYISFCIRPIGTFNSRKCGSSKCFRVYVSVRLKWVNRKRRIKVVFFTTTRKAVIIQWL